MKLSILIPAYNAERYILDNLNSLKYQSYTDWEAIVVNDGSTDNTLNKIENFINENQKLNIKVISISNGGLANARNVAMDNASGDYFCNLDADDFLEQDTLAKVADIAKEEAPDIIYYDILNFDEVTGSKTNCSVSYYKPSKLLKGSDAAIMKLQRKIWICQGVAFYKRKYITKINLINNPGINQGEDLYFITAALAQADSVKYLAHEGASIRYRSDSMMHASFNESYLQCLSALDYLLTRIKNNSEIDQEKKDIIIIYIQRERILQELRIAKSICRLWKSTKNFIQVRNILKLYSRNFSTLSSDVRQLLSKSHRLQYLMNRYTPSIFIIFCKIYRIFK